MILSLRRLLHQVTNLYFMHKIFMGNKFWNGTSGVARALWGSRALGGTFKGAAIF